MTQMQKSQMHNKKTQSNSKGGQSSKLPDDINPVVAGIAGAVVGAGVGMAGAMALKNDKVKAKAEQIMNTVGGKATEYAQDLKKEAASRFEDKAAETTEEVKKVASSDKRGN
jgi:hypothetical protein